MIYLKIFWSITLIFVFLYALTYIPSFKKYRTRLETIGAPITFVLLIPLVIMAIITNDPISLFGIDIPTEVQWIASLLITLFGAWKIYLNPLKTKVYQMDREVGEVKTGLHSLESRMIRLENNVEKILTRV